MIRHSFPKLSMALFKKLGRKKYNITPVPKKPSGGGFEQYLTPKQTFPNWKLKPSHVASARRKARYG